MNLYQKLLLAVFIPVTLVIITLDYIFPSQFFVDIIKFATMTALLLASLYVKKRYNEQLLLLLSLLLAVSGDLLFVLLKDLLAFSLPIGVSFFTISYISLIAVFSKAKFHDPLMLLTAVPVLSLVLPVAYVSYNKVDDRILPFGIIFIVVLSFMTWSAVKTLFGRYYSAGSAKLMAAAGFMILICDCSVILSLFGPEGFQYFKTVLKSIIWGAWIPAWTLIAVLIGEDKLLAEK